MVRVCQVRLGRGHTPVVSLGREASAPDARAGLVHVPGTNELTLRGHLRDHVEPGDRDQQVAVGRRSDVVHVVEERQREVRLEPEVGQRVDEDLGLAREVEPVADAGARLEENCRVDVGAGAVGGHPFRAECRETGGDVQLGCDRLLVLVPVTPEVRAHGSQAALLATDHVKPMDRCGGGKMRFRALERGAFPSDGRLDRHCSRWFHGRGHGAATRKLSTWISTVDVALPAR